MVDTVLPFAEDDFFELRAGSALMRNCGPAKRCDTIRTNLDTHSQVAEFEPYSTLAGFRTLKGVGVLFGMYY